MGSLEGTTAVIARSEAVRSDVAIHKTRQVDCFVVPPRNDENGHFHLTMTYRSRLRRNDVSVKPLS